MKAIPHQDPVEKISVNCAVITVSDTRTIESDRSGSIIQDFLKAAGHQVQAYTIIPDEPTQIEQQLRDLANRDIDVVIFNGGTGIAPRDTTYDTLAKMLEKTLPGFGELFRFLSYQEIGSRAITKWRAKAAIASRAVAGLYHNLLVFSLPGSSNGVKLAMEKLIIP